MTKAELRGALRARRLDLADAARAAGNAAITARLLARLDDHAVVAGYVAFGGEVDPLAILAAAHARGSATALPHVTARDRPLRFLRWSPGDPLHAGPYGLSQPDTDAEPLSPDLILTPLVGFDRRLNRLGQGGGFYDRAFATWPAARRIGLAWATQEVASVPADPWDVPLDALATEREWIERDGDRR